MNINHTITPETFNTQNNLSEHISKLCMQHKSSKKWILVINTEQPTAEGLSSLTSIDKSKILHVNTSKVKVETTNIERVLNKGNCSAVVIADENFKKEQIGYLSNCAKQSDTDFIFFDKINVLH